MAANDPRIPPLPLTPALRELMRIIARAAMRPKLPPAPPTPQNRPR